MILAFAFAALTLTHRITVTEIFVLAIMRGVVNAFDIPGRQAFIVEMVGKEDLMNAIALNSSMFNGARIIGPAIAGIVVARIGEGWCFFSDAVSYIAVIVGLFMMRVRAAHIYSAMGSPLERIIEGFRFVRDTAPIRLLLFLLGLVSLVAMPYTVLMPVFADRILHGGARGLGILMGATGVGALLGALTLATKTGVHGLGRWVTFSCAGFAILADCLCSFAELLALDCAARPCRLLHDAADVFVEHAHSSHGARRIAGTRDVGLFHDVHGHGAVRGAGRRGNCRSLGRAASGDYGMRSHASAAQSSLECDCRKFEARPGD